MAKAYEVTYCDFCPHHTDSVTRRERKDGSVYYRPTKFCRNIEPQRIVPKAGGNWPVPSWCPLPDMPIAKTETTTEAKA